MFVCVPLNRRLIEIEILIQKGSKVANGIISFSGGEVERIQYGRKGVGLSSIVIQWLELYRYWNLRRTECQTGLSSCGHRSIDRSTTTKQHRPINSSITTKLKRLEECVTFRVSKSPFKYIFGRWCETKNQVYNKKTTTTNLISDSYQSKEPDHDHHLMCTPEEGKIQPFFWIPQLKQPVWAVKHISGHKSFDFRPIFRSYRVPIHGRNAYFKPVEAISRETILFTCRATIQQQIIILPHFG